MVDEVAKTNIVFDATGAKRGAEEVKQSADTIVAANEKVVASTGRVVTGIDKVAASSERLVNSSSRQTAALDRMAKAFDPFLSKVGQAERQLTTLTDIIEKGAQPGASEKMLAEAARATGLLAEATNRLNTAQANQAAGFNVAERIQQLTAAFAPAQTSAQKMTAELASLNQAMELGVSIEGGYASAWDKIVLKYDEGAQAALRAAQAEKELQAQYRETAAAAQAAFSSEQNQSRFSQFMGVADPVAGAAAGSAALFQEVADLSANWNTAGTAADKFNTEVVSLNRAQELGIEITGGYAAAYQRLAESYGQVASAASKFAAGQLAVADAVAASRNNTLGGSIADYGQGLRDDQVSRQRQSGLETTFAGADKERAQVDQVFAASKAYEAQLKMLDNQLAIHNITEERHWELLKQLNTAYAGTVAPVNNYATAVKKVADNSWAARFAAQQMGVQTVQFFSSIQAGQPVLTAFIGQAHQMVDIAISTGLGWGVVRESLSKAFALLATPWGATIAGLALVGGTLAALSIHAETAQRRIEALRNALTLVNPSNVQALTEQSERVARSLSQTSSLGIDITEARAGTAALAAHSDALQINDEQAKNVMETYLKLAKALGEPKKAWDLMTAGITSASKQSEGLENRIEGVDRQLTNHLKELEEANKKGEAWTLWMRVVSGAVVNVTDNLTELEKAMVGLNNAMGTGSEKADTFATKLGTDLNSRLASVVRGFTELVKAMNQIPQNVVSGMVDALILGLPVIGQYKLAFELAGRLQSLLPSKGLLGGGTTPTAETGTGTGGSGGIVTIKAAQSGSTFQVSSAHAEAFQGLINELEARGYLIKNAQPQQSYRPGAVVAGTNRPSMHATGDAIDLPHVGAAGGTVPPEVARELANKYGMKWGGDFSQPDGMHFGFDNVPGARSTLTGGSDPFGRMSEITKDTIAKAEELRKTYDATATKADTLRGQQQLLNDVIEKLGPSLPTEELDRYKRAQAEIGGLIENNRTPQQEMIHGMQLQASLAQQLTEGDRRQAEMRQRLMTLESQHAGTAEIEVDRLKADLALQEQIRGELLQQQYANDRVIVSNKAVAAGWDVSAKAAAQAEIRMRAFDDASKKYQLGSAAHSELVTQLTEQYTKLGQAQQGTNTSKTLHDMRQAADLTQLQTEGERRRVALRQQMENMQPLGVDPAAMSQAMALENKKAEGELRQMEYTIDREIVANQKAAEGWLQNAKAASQATIAVQAYTEASNKFIPGSAGHTAAVARLTDEFTARARSQQDLAAGQQISQNRDSLDYIQMETSLLMENSDKRTIQLAQLKLEQDIKRNSPLASQPYIDDLKRTGLAITENSLALKNQQRDLATVTGAFTGAFDTISNSITQALLSGQGAAINWRNIMTSVAQQILSAFLKLAVINPIMKGVFGADVATIGSVFDTLNKTPNTPGSSSSDGGGSTGIFGSLAKLGMSIAGLFGGGMGSAGFDPSSAGLFATTSGVGVVASAGGAGSSFLQDTGFFNPLPMRHMGGLVGANDNLPTKLFPTALIAGLPRFHNGLGGNEFAAILQRGERVLTQRQQDQVRAAASKDGGDTFSFNVDARNSSPEAANTFRRSMPQLASMMSDQMSRAKARNG